MKKCFLLFPLLLLSLFFYVQATSYKYNLSIAAIFQNEGRYLKEWIEYHRLVGVEHFYLYNNESADDFKDVLDPYIQKGLVELTDWHEPNFVASGQKKAYMDAIVKAKDKTKWLAIIDVDEYLVPKKNLTVTQFLKGFEQENIAGVGINWQMFGTSNVPSIKAHELLVEKLTLKALPEHDENLHVKTIVRPQYVLTPHVHHFEYEKGHYEVDSKGFSFKGPRTKKVEIEDIQINHYWSKDEAFFHEVKVPRRLSWGETQEAINTRIDNLNKVEDSSIFPYLLKLRKRALLKP